MLEKIKMRIIILFIIIYFSNIIQANSQALQLYEGAILSSNPVWANCIAGNDTSFTVSFAIANTLIDSFYIDFGDGNDTGGVSLNSNDPFYHTYNQIGNFDVVFRSVNYLGLGNDSIISGGVVNLRPVSGSILPPLSVNYGCAPHNMCFRDSSFFISSNTTFTWEYGDGTQDVFNASQNGLPVCHTYQALNSTCNMTVTLTTENECGNSVSTWSPVNVYDIDQAAISISYNIMCYPDTILTLQNNSAMNCLTGQRNTYWDFGDGTTENWTTSLIPFTHAFPGVGIYNIMMIDSNACGTDTAYTILEIIEPPIAALSLDNDTICLGETIIYSNNSTGRGNLFAWDYGDGSSIQSVTTTANMSHSYSTAANNTVYLAVDVDGGSSCKDTASIDIVVLSSPVANFTIGNNNGCDSMTVVYTDISSGNNSWNWDFDNGNTDTTNNPSSQFYNAVGTYTVELSIVSKNGCSNSISKEVYVRPIPDANYSSVGVCEGKIASFTDMSTVSSGSITSWNWNLGDATSSILQNPTNLYAVSDTFSVILKVSTNWCSDSIIKNIIVEPLPNVNYSIVNDSGCTPLNVQFVNSTTGASTYKWDFDDGNTSVLSSSSNIFYNYGISDISYSIKLIAESTFGCKDSISKSVVIHPKPQAGFVSNSLPSCSPQKVSFTDKSARVDSYLWDFGDSTAISTDINPNHDYYNKTYILANFTVKLIGTSLNGCKDTATEIITVYPLPDNSLSSDKDSVCHPALITFYTSPGAKTYIWNYGDGEIETGTFYAPHLFKNNSNYQDTSYNVVLIMTNYFLCTDTVEKEILIYPSPVADFDIDTISGCSPFDISITNKSIGVSESLWTFGDGNSVQNNSSSFDYSYINNSGSIHNNSLNLSVKNQRECTDVSESLITVYPDVISDFICDTAGCSPYTSRFINQSYGGNDYLWEFSDSTTTIDKDPVKVFSNSGDADKEFKAKLTVTSIFGCKKSFEKKIIAYHTPQADYSVLSDTIYYPDTTFNFTNTTTSLTSKYKWTYGDGQMDTMKNVLSHTYTGWGEFTVELEAKTDYCEDKFSRLLRIIAPVPKANFLPQSKDNCVPLTVQFENLSQYEKTYEWDFGDGGSSTQKNPSYVFNEAGIYQVSLIITGDGGVDTITYGPFIVYKSPKAKFECAKVKISLPDQKLECTNASLYAHTYFWDFGDGGTSTLRDPIYQYKETGRYDIRLDVWTQEMCHDSIIKEDYVNVEEGGKIKFPNVFIPDVVSSVNNYDHYSKNNIFFPVHQGIVEYHLQIFNRWGELIFETKDINIGWDGHYNGEICKQDVYIWKVIGRYSNFQPFKKAGDVTLMR